MKGDIIMSKKLNPRHMTEMVGRNRSWFKVGKALTVTGLLAAVTGFAMVTITTSPPFKPEEYDLACEFVDALLA